MSNIVIDASPIVYGSRAIHRCTACLVDELIGLNDFDYRFIWFGKKISNKNTSSIFERNAINKTIPLPYRILVPCWEKFSWPKIENFIPNCDIFYTNEFYFPPARKAIIIATIHGLSYKIIPEKIESKTVESFNRGLRFILKHADYLIAVSETTKKELINRVGVSPSKIYVITHGVDKHFKKKRDLHDLKNQLKKKYGFYRPYLLYVGVIGLHKNIIGIISAYQKLFTKYDIDLVLAGPYGSASESAKKLVFDYNMFDRVHFLGHVHKTDDLVNLYNGANLFVFPSFYEGWTSPPLEAMACGTPVITSNCSSLPETVGDAAIKVDPNNTEELAHQMEKVLNNRWLQHTLIKRGLAHAKSHTWEKAAAKMKEVFDDIKARGHWKERKHEDRN